MSLDSYTSEGSNIRFASGILGAFWTSVFPDNGLVSSVIHESAESENVSETFLRGFPGWLTATVDGIMRVDRLEVVPVDKAVREMAEVDDGHSVGGTAVGMPSNSCRWLVKLSETYRDIPVVLPKGGSPLLQGIDYETDGLNLVMRENPASLGIPFSIENVDGMPTACWVFLLPSCVPDRKGVESNFNFYNAPQETRRALLDMLTQEGSLSRILRYLEACAGMRSPTVFEKSDEQGRYTSLEATWTENGSLHGVTSGGEILSAAGSPMMAGYDGNDNRIGLDTPVSRDIRIFAKYSESDGAGLPAGNAFVPNTEKTLAAGETGVVDPTGTFDRRMAAAIRSAGLTVNTELPAGTANPVERVYDVLGRPQPQAVSISGKAATTLSANPSVLNAVYDSIPAGSRVVLAQDTEVSDDAPLTVTDTCELFKAIQADENGVFSITDNASPSRNIVLP